MMKPIIERRCAGGGGGGGGSGGGGGGTRLPRGGARDTAPDITHRS